MSIIDQIKAEVERQAKSIENATGDFAEGRRMEQRIILSFLSTLKEQPVKDFPTTDKEMADFLATHKPVQVPDKYKTADWIFKEQPVSEGFDREFSKFSNDVDAEHPFPICMDEYEDFARHFYELGRQSKGNIEICPHFTKSKSFSMRKEQMMKEARKSTKKPLALGREIAKKILTWEDVKTIVQIADDLDPLHNPDALDAEFQSEEALYTEVLKRFQEGKP